MCRCAACARMFPLPPLGVAWVYAIWTGGEHEWEGWLCAECAEGAAPELWRGVLRAVTRALREINARIEPRTH